MAKLSVEINDREYVRSHMQSPKGRGPWAFRSPDLNEIIWSPSMTYGAAKRWAVNTIRERAPADAIRAVLFTQP